MSGPSLDHYGDLNTNHWQETVLAVESTRQSTCKHNRPPEHSPPLTLNVHYLLTDLLRLPSLTSPGSRAGRQAGRHAGRQMIFSTESARIGSQMSGMTMSFLRGGDVMDTSTLAIANCQGYGLNSQFSGTSRTTGKLVLRKSHN